MLGNVRDVLMSVSILLLMRISWTHIGYATDSAQKLGFHGKDKVLRELVHRSFESGFVC